MRVNLGKINKRLVVFFLLFMLGVSLITNGVVFAARDTAFYANNNIEIYNPDFALCTASSSTPVSGSDNQAKIWNWLIAKGMSENGAAGIMGNMQVESGFNPFRIQGRGSGDTGILRTYDAMVNSSQSNSAFGLAQWDGGRRPLVLKYITDKDATYSQYVDDKYGKTADDYKNAPSDVNDAFITAELEYMYKEATPGGNRSTAWAEMIAADSPTGASDTWEEIFEGSTRTAGGPQSTAAQAIYTQFSGSGTPPSASSSSGCGDNSSSSTNLGTVSQGGLTEEQAKAFVMKYGADKGGDSTKAVLAGPGKPSSGCTGGLLSNCTSFSAFFVNKFSSSQFQGGDGSQVVSNLGSKGHVPTGSQPKVFSVFSWGDSAAVGHTGVILGIHGDTVIVGEASCSSPGSGAGDGVTYGKGAAIIKVGKINTGDPYFGTVPTKFAYPKNVDINAIQGYINGGA